MYMTKSLRGLFAAAIIIGICVSAHAQQLKVATGSAKGSTYVTMFKEMTGVCGSQLAMVPINTEGGSIENIDKLMNNEVNAAFTQSDVMAFRAKTEDMGDIKTLVALHQEQVHYVSLQRSGLKSGGVGAFGVNIGGKDVVFNTVDDLRGFKVAAAGGSWVTAKFIQLLAEVPYEVVRTNNSDESAALLKSGKVQAAVFVGGAPLPVVDTFDRSQFKLLPMSAGMVSKLESQYRPDKVTYLKLDAQGIQTVNVESLLVTRTYTTPKMVNALSTFRSCFYQNIGELRETSGMHKAWRKVSAENKGKGWPYYDLPVSQEPVAAAPTTKKK